MRRLWLTLMAAVIGWAILPAGESTPLPCLMRPAYPKMTFPPKGFAWLESEDLTGPCADVPGKNWIRMPSGSGGLFVAADGPAGSGRFWTVTVGQDKRQARKPDRGFCFRTSTLGWRTLQSFKKGPLVWLEDLDNDGKAELLVWDSFPLNADASEAEYGLVAWVYRSNPGGSLEIDGLLSRKMARELAEAYRAPIDPMPPSLAPLRAAAAGALEAFADERCGVPGL